MKLLEPIRIGGVEFPHRIMMGSMHMGHEDVGDFASLAAFYAERVRGGVRLIVSGGISPNEQGAPAVGGATLVDESQLGAHRQITEAVHAAGGRILLQILHFGRYAKSPEPVAPSAVPSPINPMAPRALTAAEVEQTISDYARCAALAMQAGYDGVEIMGSEGYLINTFTAPVTNLRTDEWGGSAEARRRFPLAVLAAVRKAIGDGILSYRMSVLDLVPGGSTLDESLALAREVARTADLIVTGIGWHESRVPTIASPVPHAAFAAATRAVAHAVEVPVAATNRINDPKTAEAMIARGDADLVCLARPFLADPDFVAKVATPELINTCIACNQSCLDHALTGRLTSCLVNPRAGRETRLVLTPAKPRRVAVVGAGPGGLAAAMRAAERGHQVTLFEAEDAPGGQFQLARNVPGKGDYAETIRYFEGQLHRLGVTVRLGHRATVDDLLGFDEVVLATGARPRVPNIPGLDHASVLSYHEVLSGAAVGDRVAIIGAGGIGFDVASYLVFEDVDLVSWQRRWGIDPTMRAPGGLVTPEVPAPLRQVTVLQRKTTKPGAGLGPTTGWIHRAELAARGVKFVTGVTYERISDEGLRYSVGGDPSVLSVDTIVVCAGQEPNRELLEPLREHGVSVHLVGGADEAHELDAARAIRQATVVAAAL